MKSYTTLLSRKVFDTINIIIKNNETARNDRGNDNEPCISVCTWNVYMYIISLKEQDTLDNVTWSN